MVLVKDCEKIIGDFIIDNPNIPYMNAYLLFASYSGGNERGNLPNNREYLRIVGNDSSGNIIQYGYVYFTLYVDSDGVKRSSYIGCKVEPEYRGMGFADLLMSVYLYFSYDSGYRVIDSVTKQRKLDVLSLMNRYGFEVANPGIYQGGERISVNGNKMVVDIMKSKKFDGVYYRFKSCKQENLYRDNNIKIADSYNYLDPLDVQDDFEFSKKRFKKVGWVVPYEDYVMDLKRSDEVEKRIMSNLNRSSFSR